MFIRVIYGEHDIHEEAKEGGYAYAAQDGSVDIGTVVLVPATLGYDPQPATVIGFGTGGYRGDIASVLRVIRHRQVPKE